MNVSYVLVNDSPPIYEFKGDFEKFLLEVGVSSEHIYKMKNKILQDIDLLYYKCDNAVSEPKLMNVPVNKIIGVRRAIPDVSVFDNIRKIFRATSFSNSKMEDCLNYANRMSYEELKLSYSNLPDPVHIAHIIETDEYYLYGEHNHTTMCAIIFDAPFIRARVIDYHLNSKKVSNYKAMIDFYKEFNIDKIEKEAFDDYIRIVFTDNQQPYCIDYGSVDVNSTFDDIIFQLKEKLTTDKKALKIYNILHFERVKKLWYHLCLTPRQRGYIDKTVYKKEANYISFLPFTKI